MPRSDQPNILFIQADQLTSFALGCYGHPAAQTPNIDSLAQSGVVFTHAYCNSPLCGPSRNSMMAGRLPHAIGAYDNANELPASTPTFTHVLRHAGYSCWLSGKMHFVGPDQLHGFHGRTNTDIYPSGFHWTPDWTRGAYPNHGTSVRYLHQSGPCSWSLQLDYDEETQARGLRCLRDLVRHVGTRDGDERHPHDPFVVQQRYWDRYDGVQIPDPAAGGRALDSMHAFDRWIQIHHEVDTYPPSAEAIRNARRAYLAMTSYVDEKVGELLAELQRLGVDDETVVVFSSDHGDMQGEHGMWYKRTWREWSMRVPLIIRDPRRKADAGRVVDRPVSLVDLFPTFTDLAGAHGDWPGVEELDGESLVPLLGHAAGGRKPAAAGKGMAAGKRAAASNESVEIRADWSTDDRPVLAEYCGEGTIRPMRMVRHGSWKYVDIYGEEPLLFDLSVDPNEVENRAGDPSVSAVETALRAIVAGSPGWDGEELKLKIIADQKRRLFLDAALQRGGEPAWDYQPFEDARSRYVRRGNSTQGTKRLYRWPYIPPVDP